MLKLSLYGFEFWFIKEQYVIFYFDRMLPHNSIFTIHDAVTVTKQWIDEQRMGYNGPRSDQFQEKFDSLFNYEVTK